MHIHMEGKDTGLVPHLIGWIAERLEALNTPDEDIFEARITFVQRRHQEAVRVQLLLADKPLQVTQCGTTPDAAIDAALQRVQQALHEARAVKRARAVRSAEDSYTKVTNGRLNQTKGPQVAWTQGKLRCTTVPAVQNPVPPMR